MALVSNALTTVARVCRALSIAVPTGDALTDMELQIAQASDAIEAYLDRRLPKAMVTAEKLRGFGGQTLRLSRYPLVSITSVSYDGASVESAYWSATPTTEDAEMGVLRHLTGDWIWTADFQTGAAQEQRPGTERPLYSVTYVGGYVLPKDDGVGTPRTLPYQLERACIATVVALYRAEGRDPSIISEGLLSASVTYSGSTLNTGIGRGGGGIIPGQVLAQLEPFRRWS